MKRIKVYDADGKCVDAYNKSTSMMNTIQVSGQAVNLAGQVKVLNSQGYYVKGQTTSKGVKIK